jgi:octopine/nopaline transport system substrate-binding protein
MLGRRSSVGLRNSDPDLQALSDKAISEAKADGTIEKLSVKYFGYDGAPR